MEVARRPRQDMTVARGRVLSALCDLTDEKGRPPSLREIGRATSLSHVTVLQYLLCLRRDGYVWREPPTGQRHHKYATYEPTDEGKQWWAEKQK